MQSQRRQYNEVLVHEITALSFKGVARDLADRHLPTEPLPQFETMPGYWWGDGNRFRVVERYSWGAIVIGRAAPKKYVIIIAIGHFDVDTMRLSGVDRTGRPMVASLLDASPRLAEIEDARASTVGRPLARPSCFRFHAVDPVCDGGFTGARVFEPKCLFRDDCVAVQLLSMETDLNPPTDEASMRATIKLARKRYSPPPPPEVDTAAFVSDRNRHSVLEVRKKQAAKTVSEMMTGVAQLYEKEYVVPEMSAFGDLIRIETRTRFQHTLTIAFAGLEPKDSRKWPIRRGPIAICRVITGARGSVAVDVRGTLRKLRPFGFQDCREQGAWVRIQKVTPTKVEAVLECIAAVSKPIADMAFRKRRRKLMDYRRKAAGQSFVDGQYVFTEEDAEKGRRRRKKQAKTPAAMARKARRAMKQQLREENW